MTHVLRLFKKVAYFEIFNLKSDTIKYKMSNVEFLENNEFHIKSRQLLGEATTPSMVTLLLKTGIAKNEKQALFIILGFIGFVLFLTIYLGKVLLGSPEGAQFVKDQYGNQYTSEEYFSLLKEGKDPLSPNFKQ